MTVVCIEDYETLHCTEGAKYEVSGVDAPTDYIYLYDVYGDKHLITLADFLEYFEFVE